MRPALAALALVAAACTQAPTAAPDAPDTRDQLERIGHRLRRPTTSTTQRVTAQSAAAPTTVAPTSPTSQPADPPTPAAGGWATAESTAYCLTGLMANEQPARQGAVAMGTRDNPWPPLGTRIEVTDSPWGPGRFTVEDRIGHSSDLDFAMPGDCDGAIRWGRRSVEWRVAA